MLETNTFVSKLAAKAIDEAAEQLNVNTKLNIGAYSRAKLVERAIENLTELDAQVRKSIFFLMWEMERDGLYAALGHDSMLDWALTNMSIRSRWSLVTIKRYANAISRILPELERNRYVDPATGEIITPESLIENATISAITDLSYTFTQVTDQSRREEIILALVNHVNEDERDRMIAALREDKKPIQPVRIYTQYEENRVKFQGVCTPEQWRVITSMMGSFLEEHFAKEVSQ